MTVAGDVVPGRPHTIIPDGCISLVGVRPARGAGYTSLVGPRASPLSVPLFPGHQYWGIRFWPDAGALLLGAAARSLHERVESPVNHPAWAAALCGRLAAAVSRDEMRGVADAALLERLPYTPALDVIVRTAVCAIVRSRGEMTVADLAAGVRLSERQLERRFGKAVGLTPKRFARIRRMRSALAHLLAPASRSWSAVAAELGYADQAHLARDAMNLSGLTPSQIALMARAIGHESVRP